MNKSKFLFIIIIGLLISNGILFFMFLKEHNRKGGPKNIIIEKLHLDDEQINKYEAYIKLHRKAINDNETAMNKLRNTLYKQLKYPTDAAKIDSLISLISNQQNNAEHINYKHFEEIKSLCKPNQTKYFEELTNEIANLFSSSERK